ncbi:response regulator transcription factor [Kallotenue papyrolyticum]|uniref:response regulator transcription factor n=1 Tax=Kallotenue papyrolyticum TaxID=1325125 RepID=UPI0004BB0EC0|nr:response regulator transcription factor [Kallotenue papyrolyticum]
MLQGKQVIDAGLAASALSEPGNPLTERDVLREAADGATIREVAAHLHLSEGTVRNYLSSAIQKLAVRNRVEAVHNAEHKAWL